MKFVHWFVINDGVAESITADDIDASEEAAVIDRVLIPLTDGRIAFPRGKQTPYAATGEVAGKYAVIQLYDEGIPIADIAVCLHSRAAPALWQRVCSWGGGEAVLDACPRSRPRQAPWCAVRHYAPEEILPPWLDSWTQTVAWALANREGW